MNRPAHADDIDTICMALPDVEFGTSWGDRPTYLVRGKGFLLYRMPHSTAVDPETGEMYDDLIVIQTPTAAEKQALVDDPATPFFTIDHFRNYDAVLVQLSRLGELAAGKNRVVVGTGTHAVLLGDVKAFGKKQMPAADWARGVRLETDMLLGAP